MGLRQKIFDSRPYRQIIQRQAIGPLRAFYDIPPVSGDKAIRDVEFIALDLETTGLNPKKDEIVSIGWILVRQMAVDFGSCEHLLVRPKADMTESSAIVHHIFDSHVENAPDIGAALHHLLPILAGRVMISHHSPIEVGFLGQACKKYFGAPLQVPTVDTLILALRDVHRRGQPFRPGALKLQNLRKQHNLPPYQAHNALADAIAAAELFLAQMSKRDPKGDLELRDVLR
ncbi:MAG: exonuclease domain-containing protein [Pseudomonadota bacterium]